MRKIFQLVSLLLVFVTLFLSACKDDGLSDEYIRDQILLDVWWYSYGNNQRGECYFNSDGTVEVTFPVPSTGTYIWGPNDSMYVQLPDINYTLWFQKYEENYMEFRPTNEPFANIYFFSTYKP